MSASKHLSLLTWSQTTLERRVSLFFHSIFLVWLGYKWSKATNQCNSSLVNTSFSGSRLCHGFSSRQEFSAVYPRVYFPMTKMTATVCVWEVIGVYIFIVPLGVECIYLAAVTEIEGWLLPHWFSLVSKMVFPSGLELFPLGDIGSFVSWCLGDNDWLAENGCM